jgi:hypothetical protein
MRQGRRGRVRGRGHAPQRPRKKNGKQTTPRTATWGRPTENAGAAARCAPNRAAPSQTRADRCQRFATKGPPARPAAPGKAGAAVAVISAGFGAGSRCQQPVGGPPWGCPGAAEELHPTEAPKLFVRPGPVGVLSVQFLPLASSRGLLRGPTPLHRVPGWQAAGRGPEPPLSDKGGNRFQMSP